jgi:SIR2-like protein
MPLEPPYGEIADLLKRGEIIPFLGAGVNFGVRQPPDATWDGSLKGFLPSGSELARFLASKTSFPSHDEHDLMDLAKVSSYFVETVARRRLRQRLHEVFDQDFCPCDIHSYLAEMSGSCPLLIVTTNYDDLIEQAFKKLNRPFDLVVHPTDRKEVEASVLWWQNGADEPVAVTPNRLFIDLKTTTVIYKMHGTVHRAKGADESTKGKWDSYVITEDDYVDFLARIQSAVPAQFMRYFRERQFLFLGYGLRDWNLRVVLKNLRTVQRLESAAATVDDEQDLCSWAIQYRPSELEVQLWNARRIRIYDVDINEFARRLREHGI